MPDDFSTQIQCDEFQDEAIEYLEQGENDVYLS